MGYWTDLYNSAGTAGTVRDEPDGLELQPKPEEQPLWKRALSKLSDLSLLDQSINPGALEKREDWIGTAARRSGIPQAAEVVGKILGAPFAAAGALPPGATRMPPGLAMARMKQEGVTPEIASQAAATGREAGGEEAKKLITPLNVAGAVTGPAGLVGRALGAADVALGAGDIYRGVKEGDLASGAMGAIRVGLGGATSLGMLAPPTTPKSPKLSAAVEGAKPQDFFKTAPARNVEVEVAPRAQKAVEFLGNQVLKAVNESAAKGFEGAFPGEQPLLPVSQVVVDPNLPGFAHVDQRVPDTIVIGQAGVKLVLSGAKDARGVVDNLLNIISHEVQHPTEIGIGAQRIGTQLGPGGHAAGGVDDDRLMAFTQQFREHGIREAAKNHPYLGEAAAVIDRVGALSDSFLPARAFGADPAGATQPVRDLQLFHEVMETPEAARPVIPEHRMAKSPVELPLDLFQPNERLQMMGKDFLPEKPKTKLRALTGRQLPLPGTQVTNLAELPALDKLTKWVRAARDQRGKLERVNPLDVLAELEKAGAQGRVVSAQHLKDLGVQSGDLWPVYNNLDKHIRNKLGGKETPEGAELWRRLKTLTQRYPRAFSQNPRALGTNPRMVGPSDITPKRVEAPALSPEDAAMNRRAEAFEARRAVIKEGNELAKARKAGETLPEVTERLGRLAAGIEKLKSFFGILGAKGKKPGLDRLIQGEKVSRSEAFAARRAARERAKAEGGGDKLQMGREFFPEEDLVSKLSPEQMEGRRILEARLAQEVTEQTARPKLGENLNPPPRLPRPKSKVKPTLESGAKPSRKIPFDPLGEAEGRMGGTPASFRTTPEQAAGAKKAEPQKYSFKVRGRGIEKVIEPLRRKLFGAEPFKSAVAGAKGDEAALARLRKHLASGTPINPALIDSVGFTPTTRARVRIDLARASKANRPLIPEERAQRFSTLLDLREREIKRTAAASRPQTKASPAPLAKDLAKKLPEGKLSPFAERKGAAIPRKEAKVRDLLWKGKDGETLREPAKQAQRVVSELKAAGLEVDLDDMIPATAKKGQREVKTKEGLALREKIISPVKLVSKQATLKELARKAKEAGDTALLSKIENLPDYQKFSEAEVEGFDFGTVPATTSKGEPRLERIPDTLNPFSSPVRPTGGRAGKKNLLGQEEKFAKGKGGVKTDQAFNIAEHYGEKYEGPTTGVISEKVVARPKVSPKGVKVPTTAKSLAAKRNFVAQQTKEGMEEIELLIDKLGSGGRLRNVAEALEMAKQKYDYRNLLEDYLDGRPIDLDDEYLLNRGDLKRFEQRLRRKYEDEWDQLQVETEEGRLAFRSAEKLKERFEGREKATDITLPRETQSWLKEQKVPRLLGDLKKWVDSRVTVGDLKPNEAEDALEFLRRRNQAMERHVARGVSPTQRAEYMKKRAGAVDPEDFLERAALQLEKEATGVDDSPNPWDLPEEKLQTGRGFFPEELPQLEKVAKQAGKVRETSMQSTRDKLFDNLGEAANITRPLVTAVDVSNPFRQTFQLTTDQITQDILRLVTGGRYGKASDTSFRRNLVDMLKAFGSQKRSDALMGALKNDFWFGLADTAGVNFIHKGKVHESWIGHELLDKAFQKFEAQAAKVGLGIPAGLPRKLVNGSKNAFEYYQNKAMRDAFKLGMETLRDLNELNPKAYKVSSSDIASLAEYVNNAASRGAVTRNAKWDKRLNYVFFSAQMNASRVRMMGDALMHWTQPAHGRTNAALSRYARRQMMRSISGAVAASGLVYSLATLSGEKPEVEDDLRSTDFGKIKIGDVTFDGGGGWFQFVRASAQIATGKEKERGTGIIRPKNVMDTIGNFFRSKLGPGASGVMNVLTQRTVEGAPIDFQNNPSDAATTLAAQLLLPMSVEDMNSIVEENPRVSWLIPLMLLGNGVGENLGRGVKAWRTTDSLRMAERGNRAELKRQSVYQPTLSTKITIPGRDTAGRPNYYTLTPAERQEFEKEYMPLVTQLLNEFITSEAYQRVAPHHKRKVLYKKVHQLNTLYGANRRLARKYAEKAKRGEVKPSNLEPEKD